jgi:hypothetical protein
MPLILSSTYIAIKKLKNYSYLLPAYVKKNSTTQASQEEELF